MNVTSVLIEESKSAYHHAAELLRNLEELLTQLQGHGGNGAPPPSVVLAASGDDDRKFYTTKEFAALIGKAPFTVREWARLGRCNAIRAKSGRGADAEWRFPKSELLRIQD